MTALSEAPRSASKASWTAFRALLLRDLTVLRKSLAEFIPRTMLQPFMLVFVFAYVFPKIGQGVGGSGAGAEAFSTQLIAGVLGLTVIFQGIQSVALPLVNEIGFTREIEDRVLAAIALVLFAPLLALIALAVKFDSKGPVFFKQKRYGFANNEFTVFKFRTMQQAEIGRAHV